MVKIYLSVVLDKQNGVYYPEQIVSGKVSLNINDDLKVSAIDLSLKGHAQVQWTVGDDTYMAHETYIKETLRLLSPDCDGYHGNIYVTTKSDHGKSNVVLKPGFYEYPFRFQLPKNLPSSYEDDIGWVRYQVKAHIDRPCACDSYSKRVFTVATLLDLNTVLDIQNPVKSENSKELCCWCCTSDLITITMEVHDRTGFVPGETILFSSDILNRSGRTIRGTVAKLTMFVQYRAASETHSVKKVLTELTRGPIKPGGADSWRNGRLHIPPVPHSFLAYCNIIDISYYVQMKVVPSGPAYSLKVPIKIVIGSIPLKQVTNRYTLPPTDPASDGMPCILYTDTNMPFTTLQTSFAESAFGRKSTKDDEDDEHTSGDKDFAPVYAYYSWGRKETYNNWQSALLY